MQRRGWPVPQFILQFRAISVGLIDISGLHGQEYLLGFLPACVLDLGYEVHQFHRVGTTDVVHIERNLTCRWVVNDPDGTLHYIVNIGEVADHIPVVEHLDRPACGNGISEQHRGHVRTSPRSVDCKEPKACGSETIEFRI